MLKNYSFNLKSLFSFTEIMQIHTSIIALRRENCRGNSVLRRKESMKSARQLLHLKTFLVSNTKPYYFCVIFIDISHHIP